ncbi:uncharacterized protein LOC106424790 [Brassica napus]|uniref:uncharacterized protein LOC106424790 n=1 Tax=Brassica napus TaxID=3708 RepID=UPI0006AAF649|nr:uncharacterized protein LOC106424790 [Brassica napus]
MASSSLNKNKENNRSKSVNSIDDLAVKVDQLIKGNQSQVFIMEEAASENNASDVTPEADNTVDNQQEKGYQGRTYILSQAQHNQFQNQKQQTAQQVGPAPTTAPQDEINGLATMMQKLLQGQQIQGKALNQVTTDISKMNHMFTDLSTKYNNVASHMRQIDIHIAQTAESVKRQQGTLPGKTDKNPKECSAVELRSGRRLPDVAPKKLTAAEKGKQKEGEQPRSDTAPLSDKETKQPTETDPAPTATPVEHVPTREYTPKVPYPVPAKKSRKDLEEIKCKKMLEDLTIKLPLIDAIKMIPSLRSLMKGLVSGKITGDNEVMLVSKECSAVLQNKPIKKLGDPGKFVLSIQIGKIVFACSLCGLGSIVNIMPYSVAKRLGFIDFKPTRISLVSADRSVKSPVGILENLHVRVGNTFVLADFVVLELDEEPRDPLILGRPFLCTAGAIINVRQGRIDLHLGDIAMKFEVNKLLKKPMIDAQSYSVEDEDHALFS